MSFVISENFVEQPLTEEMFYTAQQQLTPCLQIRDAKWRYSLLSSDGDRWICTYDAPDAQAVRDAYRRGGYVARRAWAGDLIQPEYQSPISETGLRIVLEGTYLYLDEEELNKTKNEMLRWKAEYDIEWICSYLSYDRTRLISELTASDLEAIRAVQQKLNIPDSRLWSAQVLSPGNLLKTAFQA
ncbi:MAG TPA: nickel-binding protein [Allocoleopsis sp.]